MPFGKKELRPKSYSKKKKNSNKWFRINGFQRKGFEKKFGTDNTG